MRLNNIHAQKRNKADFFIQFLGVIFSFLALQRVSIFNLISLRYIRVRFIKITLAAHTYPKMTGVAPPPPPFPGSRVRYVSCALGIGLPVVTFTSASFFAILKIKLTVYLRCFLVVFSHAALAGFLKARRTFFLTAP